MTRTELIHQLRHETWSGFQSMAERAADMLEADAKLREAARLALDALEYRGASSWKKRQPAIAALKESK